MKKRVRPVYDRVYQLLVDYPDLRSSDKKLLLTYWVKEYSITKLGEYHEMYQFSTLSFLESTPAESITRARRMVQKLHPELRATESVEKVRNIKLCAKGTFVFREK